MDAKGFLRVDPDQGAESTPLELAMELAIDEDQLRELLDILQEFDPSGVGCFTVQESLLLQLRHAGAEPDDLAVRIIQDHCDLLSQRDTVKLRKAIGCSRRGPGGSPGHPAPPAPGPGPGLRSGERAGGEAGRGGAQGRRRRPGRSTSTTRRVPRLRVSGEYRHFLAAAEAKGDKDFIREKYRSARDFIRGVEDRNRTVLRVSAAIVDLQIEFMKHGIERLRPMVLRDVAEATGFHESTISRVVKAKTIHTPRACSISTIFSVPAWAPTAGDDVSATVVKHRIKALVQAEDPAKPLVGRDHRQAAGSGRHSSRPEDGQQVSRGD